ncbi:MAG: AAA family ATPase [Archangium sp.]|nr:AAA family ATPase [Archangium sp.]
MASQKKRASSGGLESVVERDLTALARARTLAPSYGLEQHASELVSLLTRGGKSPLLAGDQGVGKSALVSEVARRIVDGNVPASLVGGRVVELSAAGIFARTSTSKGAAELLEESLDALADHAPTVVFIRDVGLITGTSLVPVLIRALRAARLRFIFEADVRRANELLRSDETLGEKLHVVVVAEPTPERARWLVGRAAEDLELEAGIPVDPSACDMAVRLSVKFLLAQRLPRKALELLRETVTEAAGAAKERVTGEDVLARFCHATRLPRFMADDAMPLDFDEVGRFFGARLLGQTDAVQAVLRSVALLKAGLNDPRRPLGVFLFTGPTGVGKTHLAKLLAEYLFGTHERLVRLNMADSPEPGDEHVLFGNPWSQTLAGRAFTVLLLDEFEKANATCHDRFLQLFDEGQFVNAAGETVPCNNTLIVCTSNAGAEVYREGALGFSASRTEREVMSDLERRLASVFRAEFLNRFDAVCHFRPLGKVEIRRIAQREVGRVLERDGIRARQLDVDIAPDVVELLVERGYSPVHGARYLQREIEKTLTAALAIEVARRPLPSGTPVKVVVHKGQVHAFAEPKRPAKEATALAQLPAVGAHVERKKLDARALVREAEALVGRAEGVAAAMKRPDLERRRRTLLEASQAPGFWDDSEKAASVLHAFRAVDAQVGALERLRESSQVARRRAKEAKSEVQLNAAVRALEEAAREVQLAEARVASGAVGDVDEAWLEVSTATESEAAAAWVDEVVGMYLGWAARRRFEVVALAEGDTPRRVVLRVHGPGAYGFLSGERGQHRRIDDDARQVAVVRVTRPDQAPVETPSHVHATAREVKRRSGRFVARVSSEVQLRDEGSGRALQVAGSGTPAEVQALAVAMLALQGEVGAEVRRYVVGRGARVEDPRTSEATPRVKDVLRGDIDQFIAAWMTRPPEVGAARGSALV